MISSFFFIKSCIFIFIYLSLKYFAVIESWSLVPLWRIIGIYISCTSRKSKKSCSFRYIAWRRCLCFAHHLSILSSPSSLFHHCTLFQLHRPMLWHHPTSVPSTYDMGWHYYHLARPPLPGLLPQWSRQATTTIPQHQIISSTHQSVKASRHAVSRWLFLYCWAITDL